MTDHLRIVVVDDQPVIRAGLRTIIDHEPDLVVVGDAGDGAEALTVIAATNPDVVLMDVRMPILDGIEATKRLRDNPAHADMSVLVLTTFDDDEYVFGALRAGASGFLLKDATPEALLDAIRSVGRGDSIVDAAVTGRLIGRWVQLENERTPRRVPAPVPGGLTEREIDILKGLASGRSNRDLAATLYLSEATVKSHVSNLLSKLGVSSRVQAVILAYEHGIVVPGTVDDAEPGA